MNKYYSIKIPKPCHEDWNTMTPKEKGRYCDACEKTVVDFTKMNLYETQDFIHQNKQKRICGHFKQTQLDSINLFIPSHVLETQHSFYKLFLLTLLIVMGTTLFNCTNKNGAKQKIDSVEVIDSINKKKCKFNSKNDTIVDAFVEEELTIETVGEIEVTGDMKTQEEDIVVGVIIAETPPQFKNTPKNLNREEKKRYFSNKITKIVHDNFNTKVGLGLIRKQKVFIQFKINEKGNVIDIKARAAHPKLEEEAKRVIKLLPQFIPAKQRNKPITVVYSLPIIFQVEES